MGNIFERPTAPAEVHYFATGRLRRPRHDSQIEHWTRELGGAWVEFGDGATVKKVSLLSDYSAIRIRNLRPGSSAGSVQKLLADVGITISTSDVNVIQPEMLSNAMAIIKVKDPEFAKSACWKLETYMRAPDLEVNQIPVPLPVGSSFGIVDSKNVRCSWHRPTRTVTLYFEDRESAFKSFHKFRNKELKICGLSVKSQVPVALDANKQGGEWEMVLEGLVDTITDWDIVDVFSIADAPFYVDMGEPSYETDLDVDSTVIKSLLYEVGSLERWDVFGDTKARRIKAQARFVQESEALDAVSRLNETSLPFNPPGKLYLQHVHLVKFRVSNRVHNVIQNSIELQREEWEQQFVTFSALPEHRSYRVLKLESQDRHFFTQAKEALERIINGTVMTLDGKNIWCPDFRADRRGFKRLQEIERELGVVIIRDIRSSNFRVFGPQDKFLLACEALHQLVEDIQPGRSVYGT
ncbi:hypothetical protein IL306_014945 [Fusarium sp. DS 682]|nr:hypothetical protein IL306_014945 [Fusarium sp. DS 682]